MNTADLPSGKEILKYFRQLDRKSQIRLGATSGLGIFFVFFIAWPAWVVRPQVESQIRGLRENLTLAESKIRLEPKILEEQRQYETFIQNAWGHLLTENEAQGLIGILNELGEKADVKLLSTQPQTDLPAVPDVFKGKYVATSYVLAVEGGFHALASFVSEIENYSKILRVDELSISPREEETGSLVGEVRVTAFLLKQGAGNKLPGENLAS